VSPGALYKEASHRFGGCGEEVAAAVPLLRVIHIHQPQVRLVHQRRRLQRLPGLLVHQPLRCQLPQFLINERQQLFRRNGIALLNRGEDACDLIHGSVLRDERGSMTRCNRVRPIRPAERRVKRRPRAPYDFEDGRQFLPSPSE
jgi:hypothetical protein